MRDSVASHAEPPFAFPKNWIWICPPLRFNSEIQGFLRSETRSASRTDKLRRGERAINRLWIFKMSNLVAIAERSSNLFWTKLRLIAALRAAETERSGGQKGRGLGGRNFCPPSLSYSDFSAAAEFRISLCEKRRQDKRRCAWPAHPCAHNKSLLPDFVWLKAKNFIY